MKPKPTIREHVVDYLPQIRRIVSKIAYDKGVVDDVTQECCARIIEKESLWDGNTKKINQWMNVVSRNVAIRAIFGKKKANAVDPSYLEDVVSVDERPDFDEENIDWLMQQFQVLTNKQKQVLVMKYFNGMSITDIARALDVSQPTVSEHVSNALKTLRKRARRTGMLASLFLPWKWFSPKNTAPIALKAGCAAFLIGSVSFIGFQVLQNDGLSDHKVMAVNDFELSPMVPVAQEPEILLSIPEEEIEVDPQPVVTDQDRNIEKVLHWLQSVDRIRYANYNVEGLKRRKRLVMCRTQFEEKDLLLLKYLPRLKELSLREAKIQNSAIKYIVQLKQLEKLNISYTALHHIEVGQLAQLSNLKSLDIAGLRVGGKVLDDLGQLENLEELNVRYTLIKDRDMNKFLKFSKLKTLDLSGIQLSEKSLSKLELFEDLKHLGLSNTSLTDEGFVKVLNNKGLKTLLIGHSGLLSQSYEGLAKLPNLTRLVLYKAKIGRDQLSYLERFSHLKKLSLESSNLRSEDAHYLCKLDWLKHLNIRDTKLTTAVLDDILGALHKTRVVYE